MGDRRVSSTSIILMSLLCMLVFHSNMIHADEYIVGDEKGWSFGVQNWPSGKTFKAGDTLVFNYSPMRHNVHEVNEAGYNSCTVQGGTGFYTSGADRVTLAKGANYFLCGVPGHCDNGMMKIAVNAD